MKISVSAFSTLKNVNKKNNSMWADDRALASEKEICSFSFKSENDKNRDILCWLFFNSMCSN